MRQFTVLGLAAAVAAYPFILISITLSPWFGVYDNALSDLGNTVTNGSVGYIFNLGLITAGGLMLVFSVLLLRDAANRKLPGVWVASLMLTSSDLILVGIFPENAGSIHGTVSLVFFIMSILTILAYSIVSWLSKSAKIGAIALTFVILSSLVWLVEWPWTGVAIQEISTAVMSSTWLVLTVSRLE